MTIKYKSDDGLSALESCAYFWNEKGDPTRYTGFENCSKEVPELKAYWDEYQMKIKLAEIEYEKKMQILIDNHDPRVWGN